MTKQELPRKKGDVVTLGSLSVKKHDPGVYSANVVGLGRNRWGTATEILEDVTYFEATGTLPISRGTHWQ